MTGVVLMKTTKSLIYCGKVLITFDNDEIWEVPVSKIMEYQNWFYEHNKQENRKSITDIIDWMMTYMQWKDIKSCGAKKIQKAEPFDHELALRSAQFEFDY